MGSKRFVRTTAPGGVLVAAELAFAKTDGPGQTATPHATSHA